MDHKRSAAEAGLPEDGPQQKSFRMEDFLESMDPSVRIKLRSMFDDNLIQAGDLDERNIEALRRFDAAVALEVLENYSHADFSTVRNRRAYLAGAIKRKAHMTSQPRLHPDVQSKLNALTGSGGAFRLADLDQRCMETLGSLHPAKALTVLERFGGRDFRDVRNPAALFMAIARSLDNPGGAGGGGGGGPPPPRDDWGPPPPGYGRGPGGAGGGGPPGYGPPPPHHHQPLPPPRYGQPHALLPGDLAGLAGVIAGVTGQPPPGAAVGGPPPPQLVSYAGLPPGALLAAPGQPPQYVLYAGGPPPPGAAVAGPPPPGPYGPPPPLALPPGVPGEWAAGRRQYGLEQAQLGVRAGEFQGLSPFAAFVHPSPALKLQQLWDEGNELVSMLDDKVWQVLAETPAPEALAVIEEAAEALRNPRQQIRNINAYFMAVMRKIAPHAVMPHHDSRGAPPGSGSSSHWPPGSSSSGHDHGGPPSSSRWDRGDAGGGGEPSRRPPHEPGMHLLPPELRAAAAALCAEHAPLLREEHFDEGVTDMLLRLPPGDAAAVLAELGQNSMAGVRNLPAYIMGICKRYSAGHGGARPGRAPAAGAPY